MYIDKSDDIVNEYNNTYHRIIKIKPLEVKSSTYNKNNTESPKFKVGDNIRISKYKKYFCKRLCSKLL